MNLILLGAPGAGKGTQASLLKNQLQIPHISTGEMLREAMVANSDLGLKAEKYMSAGQLLPDPLIIDLMEARLQADDCQKGYLLDGFPRTVAQAGALEKMLEKNSNSISAALNLEVPEANLVERLLQRKRADDREDTVRERLKVYYAQTAPVVNFYERRGLLQRILGTGTMEEISKRLVEAIAKL